MSEEHDQRTDMEYLAGNRLRRRARRRRSVYKRPFNVRLLLASLLLLAFGLGGFAYYQQYRTSRYTVALNGKPMVTVASRAQGEEVIRQLKRKYAPNAPAVVTFKEGTLSVKRMRKAQVVYSPAKAIEILDAHLTKVLEGYAIFVNREPLVLLDTRAHALSALAMAQQRILGDQDGIPTFTQRVVVDVLHQTIGEAKHLVPVMTPEQAARELTHPPRPQYATVQRGGSFYAIAMAHGLTVERIKQLNPTMDPGALQPGDQVRLPDITAPLTVVVR